MSDMERPEIFIDVKRLRELQALAMEGVRPGAVATTETPVFVKSPDPTLGQKYVDSTSRIVESDKVFDDGTPDNSNWRSFSVCKGVQGYFFGPDHFERKEVRRARESRAKSFCRICPVTQFCLEQALARGEQGIWGGTNEDERRRIKSR